MGFVVDKVALGQVFSEYFRFTWQFGFNQMLHTHLSSVSSEAARIGHSVADVPSGLCLTPPQETKKKCILYFKTNNFIDFRIFQVAK
jgi:hypothetical protein